MGCKKIWSNSTDNIPKILHNLSRFMEQSANTDKESGCTAGTRKATVAGTKVDTGT